MVITKTKKKEIQKAEEIALRLRDSGDITWEEADALATLVNATDDYLYMVAVVEE